MIGYKCITSNLWLVRKLDGCVVKKEQKSAWKAFFLVWTSVVVAAFGVKGGLGRGANWEGRS